MMLPNSTTQTDAEETTWDALAATPCGFVELMLGLSLYEWQDDALAPLDDLIDDEGFPKRTKISVVAPNGSGKSERIVAGAILYWLAIHKRGRVVVTSCVGRQISEQIWPALKQHESKFPERTVGAGSPARYIVSLRRPAGGPSCTRPTTPAAWKARTRTSTRGKACSTGRCSSS